MQSSKQMQMLLGFDDLLTRLDTALQQSPDQHLAEQITAQYKENLKKKCLISSNTVSIKVQTNDQK